MAILSHRKYKSGLAAILVIAGFVFLLVKAGQAPANGPLKGRAAVVYRSATCGCCSNYVAYLRRAGAQVEEKISEDMPGIKKRFGVPEALTSCHTVQIGDYTVEGHVPAEAIQKLLAEKPAVSGIALPGMPSGSPGMPGSKYGTFDIASFTDTGFSAPYISL